MNYDRAIGYLNMCAEAACNNAKRAVAYGTETEAKQQTEIEEEYRAAIVDLQESVRRRLAGEGGEG